MLPQTIFILFDSIVCAGADNKHFRFHSINFYCSRPGRYTALR